ncbi:MAG: hypothetical protein P8M66_06920 [Flavobacteriaceae bacterium]|jgi:hypothetical protein|nr:hypothetical protein [Flavobacteriaceae bacterium]MDG2499227.1 hypothetical protein [Flavobacteriaceae bacterium]
MLSLQTILNKIQNSNSIDFGDLFNETLGVFKKVWVQGLLLQLFSLSIMIPFIIVFYIPYFSLIMESTNNQSLGYNEFNKALFEELGLYMILAYLSIFVLSIASSILYLGFYRIVKEMDQGNPYAVSDFFYFFNSSRIGKSVGLLLAYFGISVLAALLCFLPLIYAVIPLMFMFPVFAYNSHLTVSEIIKVAFALGNKKWGISFLILILNVILLYAVSFVTCGLGSLFVSCFLYLPQYIIYKKVIGFDMPESESQTIV